MIPATTPEPPFDVRAEGGNASATVHWEAPNDGGMPILGYTVTGGGTCNVFGTTAQCTGLTNGNQYIFSVYANNMVGAGSPATSNPVTPLPTKPDAPINVRAEIDQVTNSTFSVKVNWEAPNDGGSQIKFYTVTPNFVGSCTVVHYPDTTATCSGLTDGVSYIFTVEAFNEVGSESADSNELTTPALTSTLLSSSLNTSPTGSSVTISAQVSSASGTPNSGTVRFYSNGEVINDCANQPVNAGVATCTTSTTFIGPNTYSVKGAFEGAADYLPSNSPTFTQWATNVVTTATSPSAPAYVTAAPGNGQVVVRWLPPRNTGKNDSSSILYGVTGHFPYTISTSCTKISGTSCVVTGLSNGTPYMFKVTAAVASVNSGKSAPYLAGYSNSATPKADLVSSLSTLILSVKNTNYPALTGNARQIILTNTSGSDITDLSIDFYSSDSTGTKQTSTCKNTLFPNESCVIKVFPGTTVSKFCASGLLDIYPPDRINVNYTSTSYQTMNIPVLTVGYNCLYQGGYLFAIDDTTPLTSSITGTVVATTNLYSTAIKWSSSTAYSWGTDDLSLPSNPSPTLGTYYEGQLACEAKSDGRCNFNNLMAMGITDTNTYSIGCSLSNWTGSSGSSCSSGTSGCYNDWYLPSICELDSGAHGYNTCPSGMQSVQSNIVGMPTTNPFWSSTEYSSDARNSVWILSFTPSITQKTSQKTSILMNTGRCVRELTNQ